MRIHILSDIHLEFHKDRWPAVVDRLTFGADVLVLAGDICRGDQIQDVMRVFCARYPHVIYVHGNHEYYGNTRPLSHSQIAAAENKNLHWLNCNAVKIDDVHFVGAPLWFKRDDRAPKWAMNDFHHISNFEEWVYGENTRATEFLWEHVTSESVVVTHHLPLERSVAPQYKNNPLNPFFLCDMSDVIKRRMPELWIHGHTHEPMDYIEKRTRVVCNPLGYPHETPRNFQPGLIVDV